MSLFFRPSFPFSQASFFSFIISYALPFPSTFSSCCFFSSPVHPRTPTIGTRGRTRMWRNGAQPPCWSVPVVVNYPDILFCSWNVSFWTKTGRRLVKFPSSGPYNPQPAISASVSLSRQTYTDDRASTRLKVPQTSLDRANNDARLWTAGRMKLSLQLCRARIVSSLPALSGPDRRVAFSRSHPTSKYLAAAWMMRRSIWRWGSGPGLSIQSGT